MSSLRLLDESTASGVTTMQITDVFSADFDVYVITCLRNDSTNGQGNLKYIASDGSVISDSNYDFASLYMYTHTTHTESRLTGQNQIQDAFANYAEGGSVTYIFNPFASDKYSYNITQSINYAGTTTPSTPMRCIGVLEQTASMTGFQILEGTGGTMTNLVRTYGLRVDS